MSETETRPSQNVFNSEPRPRVLQHYRLVRWCRSLYRKTMGQPPLIMCGGLSGSRDCNIRSKTPLIDQTVKQL